LYKSKLPTSEIVDVVCDAVKKIWSRFQRGVGCVVDLKEGDLISSLGLQEEIYSMSAAWFKAVVRVYPN